MQGYMFLEKLSPRDNGRDTTMYDEMALSSAHIMLRKN